MRFSRTQLRRIGILSLALAGFIAVPIWAQEQKKKWLPGDTEIFTPEPPVVTPGAAVSEAPPSDAVVLFDGTNLDQWVKAGTQTPASWTVIDGTMKVNKKGNETGT